MYFNMVVTDILGTSNRKIVYTRKLVFGPGTTKIEVQKSMCHNAHMNINTHTHTLTLRRNYRKNAVQNKQK